MATFSLPKLIQLLWFSLTSRQKVAFGLLEEKAEDMDFLKDLVEGDRLSPIVDRCFPFEEIAEAHLYVESGQKMGNVAIKVTS